MNRFIAISLLVVQTTLASPATSQYSDAPFKAVAIEPARAIFETVTINNWLNANYSRITEPQMQGAREHLHALIDAKVKESYAQHKSLRPPEPDRQLAILYSWASRLGVYGADLVYAAVKGDYPVSPPPGPQLPTGIGITLQAHSLVFRSIDPSWQIAVPFHFFPFVVREEVTATGQRSQAVAISTGTAPGFAAPGYSQATMLLIYGQNENRAVFENEWLQKFQIPPETALNPIETTDRSSRITYDPKTRLYKEVVFVSARNGSFAVLYSGLDGTYQVNRPHFVDFLRSARFR